MTYILIWLSTILISLGMDIILIKQITKDLADKGYLSDFKYKSNNIQIRKLIPIINVITSFLIGSSYMTNKEKSLNSLIMTNELLKMTAEEKEIYQNRPTAMKVKSLLKKRRQNDRLNINKFILDKKASGTYKFIKEHPYLEIIEVYKNDENLNTEELTRYIRDDVFAMVIAVLTKNNQDKDYLDQDVLYNQYVTIMNALNKQRTNDEDQKIIEINKKMLEIYKDVVLEYIAQEEVNRTYKKK